MSGLAVRFHDMALVPGAAPFDGAFGPGAIIGLAGLDGHGQDTFLECLAGLRVPASGGVEVERDGETIPLTGFRQAARLGVVYLPRDRRKTGIFPNMSVYDNFGIASLGTDAVAGFLDFGKRRRRYEALKEQFAIVADNPRGSIVRLSGGNQQKVLLARLLARDPGVLLLNDPTRGVDVATRRILYRVFRQLADQGMTLVVLSSEIEEAVQLCDRVLVFREQHLSRELDGALKTSDNIIAAMFGEAA